MGPAQRVRRVGLERAASMPGALALAAAPVGWSDVRLRLAVAVARSSSAAHAL